MKLITIGLVLLGMAAVPQAYAAGANDACEKRARQLSGYYGNRIPEFNVGPFTARISGSVAIGVSRSSGGAQPHVPRGAGQAARDRREAEERRDYERILADCRLGR